MCLRAAPKSAPARDTALHDVAESPVSNLHELRKVPDAVKKKPQKHHLGSKVEHWSANDVLELPELPHSWKID